MNACKIHVLITHTRHIPPQWYNGTYMVLWYVLANTICMPVLCSLPVRSKKVPLVHPFKRWYFLLEFPLQITEESRVFITIVKLETVDTVDGKLWSTGVLLGSRSFPRTCMV